MARHKISIQKEFKAPLEQIFSKVCDHEIFGQLIGTTIIRTKAGSHGILNGIGSVRKIIIPPFLTFEETVTDYISNEFFEYKITKGSPLKNHIGQLRFSHVNDITKLRYTIEFDMKLPINVAGRLLAKSLEQQISKGLDKLN